MSNVSLANNKKKKNTKIKSSLKNSANKSILEKKKQLTNPDVFEMKSFLNDEERDEKLEIFYKKEIKKSNLPSISEFLLSSNKDSGISSLIDNSIEKPQQTRNQKYPQNGDIFTSTIPKSTFNYNRQFDESTSSPLNKNNRNSYDYTISDMFSDGLSQKHHYEQEFTYISSSVDSEADFTPLAINENARKTGDFLIVKKDCKKNKKKVEKKNLENNRSESNSLCANFEMKKRGNGMTDCLKMDHSLKGNKEFKNNKTVKKSSTTVVSSGKKDTEIKSLLYNPINEYLLSKKQKFKDNGEPCIVCRDKNLTSSPLNGITKKINDCSTSDSFYLANSNHEMIYDVDFDKYESNTVNIVLSECNLDYLTNSEDLTDGSLEMINEKADKYLMDDGFDLITEEKSVLWENSRMNCTRDENLEFSDLLLNKINFSKKDSVIESAEAINTSQNSFQSSDSCKELLNIGSQLSGRSTASPSHITAIDFSPRYRMSFEKKNVIYPDSKNSSFDISQAMYVKQRSSCFNRKKTKDKAAATFKMDISIPKEVDKFRTEIHLPLNEKHNFTSEYEYNDSDKENKRQISFPHKQHSGHKDFGKECTDSSAIKSASFNSMTKSLKRRYPFDKNSGFFNIEMNDNRKKAKQTVENVGTVLNTWSESRHISIDQISSSNFNAPNISNENSMERSSLSNFWKVSHEVQNFVKVWLDKEDAINCKYSENFVDKEKLLPKYRQLDLNSEEREKGIDINPEMLLSNYSSEYEKSYMIKRFKI